MVVEAVVILIIDVVVAFDIIIVSDVAAAHTDATKAAVVAITVVIVEPSMCSWEY